MQHLKLLVTKRRIQIVLGLLWLLDGGLQLQRQMFTTAFANQVIAPAAQGQPLLVSGPVNAAVRVIAMHPALWNCLFAGIQLAIGLLILYKVTARIGLRVSIIWALLVWYIGEGLGGILGVHTLLLMGAPGAALLYAILALAVMPSRKKTQPEDNRPAYWLPVVWAVIWIGGAMYQLLPGQNTSRDLAMMVYGNSSGAPGWLAAIDQRTTHHLFVAGGLLMVWLVVVQLLIGILIFSRTQWRNLAIIMGIVLSLIFWVVGQNLGGYYTGLATDPNSAPLFILLAFAILGCQTFDFKILVRKSFKNLEQFLT